MRTACKLPPMEEHERSELAETMLRVGGVLLSLAVRTVADGPAGVTVVQHRVLVSLAEEGTLTVNQIARRLGVDQSNASRLCARLERLGLLARRRARHDGRAVDVALTPAGERQVSAVNEARRKAIAAILARMPDQDARSAVLALQRFGDAARSSRQADPAWAGGPA
jgi:DNA-binding MarR family transcriptional regulator